MIKIKRYLTVESQRLPLLYNFFLTHSYHTSYDKNFKQGIYNLNTYQYLNNYLTLEKITHRIITKQ